METTVKDKNIMQSDPSIIKPPLLSVSHSSFIQLVRDEPRLASVVSEISRLQLAEEGRKEPSSRTVATRNPRELADLAAFTFFVADECPEGLRPMKDGSGCYDYSLGTDCTDGFNGGCEQLCLQQLVPLPDDPTSSNVLMFCGCVQEYKLAADGRSCLLLADNCEGPKCPRQDTRFNNTLFSEMLHGYNNKTQQVNLGQVFQMTFRDNNFIKDFPQLADGLMVIPLPVEEQCRGVLSEPLPNLQLLTGDAQFSEGMGYPMVQQWRVRSNLYKVKLSAITLSTGFSKVLKAMTADSTRDELLSFIQQYGSHYISEALYGSELTCNIYFPSKKTQQQLWLQYQKAPRQRNPVINMEERESASELGPGSAVSEVILSHDVVTCSQVNGG
ncbi:hypothetical protein AOLI_G00264160 [Acnodon oligacanthus]